MSAATDILEELTLRGVAAQVDGGTIRLKPRSSLDDSLLARLKAHKPEVLAALSGSPALCSPTCWHCAGSGQCDCMTCGRFETRAIWKSGPCKPCEARESGRVQ